MGCGGRLFGLGLGDNEILAHFVQAFGADAANGKKIVDAFEGAVGFAGIEDFLGGGGANAGDELEFGGACRVQVDGVRRRLFLCG